MWGSVAAESWWFTPRVLRNSVRSERGYSPRATLRGSIPLPRTFITINSDHTSSSELSYKHLTVASLLATPSYGSCRSLGRNPETSQRLPSIRFLGCDRFGDNRDASRLSAQLP
jgi:hypothetical protein